MPAQTPKAALEDLGCNPRQAKQTSCIQEQAGASLGVRGFYSSFPMSCASQPYGATWICTCNFPSNLWHQHLGPVSHHKVMPPIPKSANGPRRTPWSMVLLRGPARETETAQIIR